ncbi:MAG TPA: sigma-70 family RNA polymerase sigma factor [Coprobacillaceae bacterium]|nr:sigma-70 family RNA polymerase sigma factor [Coprobacillaceae bacterium]
MSYNYRKEYAKWKRWKEQEERILKQMNMPKNKINELREFDWAQFNDERRFTRKQNITNDQYFALIPVNDKKEFKNINDILDSIEDEALYEYLKDEEPVLLTVILLKIQEFSIKEISKVINIPISTIYRKIEKIKRNFR